jgi:hypothetical protein
VPYPVSVRVEPALESRNRLTTLFRLILAIPHILLVGSAGLGLAFSSGGRRANGGAEGGLFGAIAFCLAIVSWFTIVIAGTEIAGIRQFTYFYLRWRARALAYLFLLADDYPPFGDGPYPASFTIEGPIGPRDRLTVAFRLLLAIPHFIALAFLSIAWGAITIVSWLIILFTGTNPAGLAQFSTGVLRWRLRVEAYMLLLVDEYPPFSLEE